jgi:aspartyl-tRNA(Asn)/glutamyl-tRNA(Gln) amidotransferase subunit C
MAVTREEVAHVALLAKLEVSPDQVEAFQRDLDAILEHFRNLDELDTENIKPMSHALDLVNVFQPDVPEKQLTQEEALANAPQKAYGHFRVPRVIE